jgi:hypothetical protein
MIFKKRFYMRLIAIILTAFCLFSCASSKADTNGQAAIETATEAVMQNTVELTGRVTIFGNEPFTYAGISGEDGKQYAIYPQEKENELKAYQTLLMRFTVVFLEEEKVYGSLYMKGGTVQVVGWEVVR